ncbi:hypothetical protein [Thermococcus henrietii]|uniref:hypothetical protein n=1 Tax=Thermococcus henrietii TaxID=2016361 RepID=UPI001314EAD3|nr:hypothetical protein [Thermococcus henrietii]
MGRVEELLRELEKLREEYQKALKDAEIMRREIARLRAENERLLRSPKGEQR